MTAFGLKIGEPAQPVRPLKRSLTLQGHRTSVSLEEPFWRQFQEIARAEGISVNALAARIDVWRDEETSLAAAIRIFILNWVLERRVVAAHA